jgi:hypothetical protein
MDSRRVTAVDVGKEMLDVELALANHRVTMARLEALAARETNTMADMLSLEKEVNRVRGEIERLEGERRFMQDRVAFSTLEISLARKSGAAIATPHARVYPGPALFAWSRIGPDGLEAMQLGAGAVVSFDRAMSLDLAVFGDQAGTGRLVIATIGGATYSQLLGNGERQFLNPYLGMRLGYAYLDGSRFVAAADVGIELVKTKVVQVDLSLRAMALIGGEIDGALQGSLAVTLAF